MDAITRLYASVYYLAFIVKRDVVLYSLKMIKDLVVSKKHCTVNHNVLKAILQIIEEIERKLYSQ